MPYGEAGIAQSVWWLCRGLDYRKIGGTVPI